MTLRPNSHSHQRSAGCQPKILLLFEYSTLNGGENSMLAVIERLRHRASGSVNSEAGFDFHALVPDSGPLLLELQRLDVPTTTFCQRDAQGQKRPREELLAELRQVVDRIAPDLMHANSLSMGRLTGALGHEFHCVRTGHLRDIIRLSKAAVRDLNQNDRLIAVSQATADAHLDQGFDKHRVEVVYNGVDCERFRPRERTDFWHNEFGATHASNPKRFVALTVGQIGLRKGLDTLTEAAVELGADRGIDFVLVGERFSQKDESIEFDRQIDHRFAEAGLSHRLHRLGYRTDVARLMNESHVLVHAAKQEPFGRVLLEAAASGLPIVATDVGGTREMLADDESASLVPPQDPTAMVNAIRRIRNDSTLSQRLSTSARQDVSQRFNIDAAAKCLAESWLGLLDRQ